MAQPPLASPDAPVPATDPSATAGLALVDGDGAVAPARPDAPRAPGWRLDAVASTARPHHVEIAPDGTGAVYVLDAAADADLWLLPLPAGPPERLTAGRVPVGAATDTAPSWSPDGTRVAYTAAGEVCVVDVATGAEHGVFAGDDPVWVDRDRLVATVVRGDGIRLVVTDVDDPWPRPLGRGRGVYGRAAVSPDGRLLVCTFRPAEEPARVELRLVDVDTGDERTVADAAAAVPGGAVWAPGGTAVAFVSDRSGWREVHLLELARGVDAGASVDAVGIAERQLTAVAGDFAELTWDRGRDRLGATRARAGATDLVTVDPGSGWVEVVAGGGTWSSPRWASGDRVLAVYEDDTCPPAVTGVVIGGRRGPRSIVRPAPRAVTAAPHARATSVSFPSEDGLVVHGRLLRPRDTSAARRAPAIVAIHDGPDACAGDAWDGLAQYFVDKGYAWLVPAYRGSTGYGRAFEREGHGGWGVDDAADCLFAGEYLAKLGWVDEERIAVVGYGHGGTLALGALTRDPGRRFAAGVCVGADVDLRCSWAVATPDRRLTIEAMMGHPGAYGDAYHAASPLHRLDALAAPVLVVHGGRDPRAPLDGSRRLVDALRHAGATVEHVIYPTEGNDLVRREPRLHFARQLERFLDWHLL